MLLLLLLTMIMMMTTMATKACTHGSSSSMDKKKIQKPNKTFFSGRPPMERAWHSCIYSYKGTLCDNSPHLSLCIS